MRLGRLVGGVVCLGLLVGFVIAQAEKEPKAKPAVTSVPRLPMAVNDALQDRDFAKAVELLDTLLAEEKPANPDYLTYMKARALADQEKFAEATAVYDALEKNFPKSDWLARSRFGRGAILARQRNYQGAAAIYRAEAERLLSTGRTDELTAIYLEFADKFFEGERVAGPTSERKPDYQQALGYYQQALQLRPSLPLRQKIELRIARCHLELNQLNEAINAYKSFLANYAAPTTLAENKAPGQSAAEAQFQLGRAQLAAGQPAEARKTWQDFLNDVTDKTVAPEMRAEATYRLAHTYGMPTPPTIGDLELGVAALQRFVKEYPTHALAAQAEFEIAQGYVHHGRQEQAVAQLKAMIAKEAYAKSTQVPAAWHLLGQVYAGQKKFDEAIATWRQFLEKYPTDPKWSEVQRVIIDTEFAAAAEERAQKNFAAARKLWETFLNKYPLDPRAAQILFLFGEMQYQAAVLKANPPVPAGDEEPVKADSAGAETLFQAAIADWERLVSKYPGTNEASQAAYMIGVTLEQHLGKLPEALAAYKTVQGSHQGQAQQAIANLTAKQLQIVTERKFRSNEKPSIKLTTRNIETLSVKIYRIDLADYFRKMHLARGVESLDIALIDPDKSWDQKVESYTEYRRMEQAIEIPVEGPGVTAVTVSSETLEATTMVVVSDVDVIVKSSRNELFIFAQNMLDGKPAEGVNLLVSDGSKVFAEVATGKDGILQKSFEELKSVNDLRVFAIKDNHSASSQVNLEGLQFAVGLSPKGYLYTDRPAYRAGQLVNIKGIIRWVDNDRYVFKTGEKFQLNVYDSRGRVLHNQDVTLGDFGTLTAFFSLPNGAPQGSYRVHVQQPAKNQSFETTFEVHEYQLEPVHFTVDLPQTVYYRGDHVKGKFVLKYYYGTPISGRKIQYRLGDDRWHEAETDANGEVAFDLPTQRYSESQALTLVAQYPERNLGTQAIVQIATRGFQVGLSTLRSVYIAGETFDLTTTVTDAAGKPLAQDLKLEVFRQVTTNGRTAEVLEQTHEAKTVEKTGKAEHTVRIEKAGQYTLRATGTDRFGNLVSGSMSVMISGDKDAVRLRILSDKHHYKVGDTGKVQFHWREKPALALVTYDGASILGYKLIELKTGSNAFDLPMEERLAPNFNLAVAVMQGNRFHAAESEFRVARELKITLKPSATTLKPGDQLTVEITATDAQGKPVSAELTLGLIQKNLLEMFPDNMTALEDFFNGGSRQVSVRAFTSCTFRYDPSTQPINEFLLAEERRIETRELEDRSRAVVMDNLARDSRQWNALPLGGLGGAPAPTAEAGTVAATPEPASDAPEGAVEEKAKQLSTVRARRGAALGKKSQSGAKDAKSESEELGVILLSDGTSLFADVFDADGDGGLGMNWNRSGNENFSVRFYENGRGVQTKFMNLNDLGRTHYGYSLLSRADNSVLGINFRGEFQVLNGLDVKQLQEIAGDAGLEILPEMANAETGFWNPSIVTDKDGKAVIVFKLPDRSTAWKLKAKGVNAETLGGQTEAEIVTKKDLFAELQTPQSFTAGDKAEVSVEVHNAAIEEGTIDVTLKATNGDKSTELKKQLKVTKKGVETLTFPVEITAGESVSFELTVASGEARDVSAKSVPIAPYGLPVYATASGTSGQSTSFQVNHPEGVAAENPTLEIVIGPSVNRTLLDAVLGSSIVAWERRLPQPRNDVERAVSDVLGGVSLLKMIGHSRTSDTPEAQALAGRIAGGVSLLVTNQRDDGGWSWSGKAAAERPDRYLTSRVMWALSLARKAGFAVPNDTFDKGVQNLSSQLAAAAENDIEGRAILLHGLAEANAADFAAANRLHRSRNQLSSSGLVHVALALLRMDRKSMAVELIELAKPKIPVTPPPAVPTPRVVEDIALRGCIPWMQSGVELRSLYLAALNEIEPAGETSEKLATWLMSARVGSRWLPEKANGPAVIALADWFGRAKLTPEKYTLTITANDKHVEKLTIDPAVEPSRTLTVPANLLVAGKPQVVRVEMEGRGRFSYSAVLSGFVPADKLKSTTNDWYVSRTYEPAQRMMDGEMIPRGFDVLTGGYEPFTNPITQLPVGERAEVSLNIYRTKVAGTPNEQLDYLVVTEPIPAGTSVLTDSISGTFDRYEIAPGAITFYIGDRPYLGGIRYSLVGYVPGEFKTAPTLARSFYQPERIVVTKEKSLAVLARGEVSKDEYRLTPRELFEFGKRFAAKREYGQAAEHLTTLFKGYRLNDDTYRQTVTMLFDASLAENKAAEIVQFFEIIKEKFADVEVSFDNILKVGAAYAELGEYERSYLVYRATAEANFQREGQISGFLDQRGEFLRSVQVMERLLREYPAEAYVAVGTYALAQEVFGKAPEAPNHEGLRKVGLTRIDLMAASVQMLDAFLATWPTDPAADQASFSLATALLELEQFQAAADRSAKFAARYPESKLLDSFWYVIGYSQFALGRHEEALEMCKKVAEFKRKDPQTGAEIAAASQWQAIYIMGQVYHSLGKPAQAIEEYLKVKDRFADANEAIDFFTRKDLSLPEVTVVKPGEAGKVKLKFRNVAAATVKVYRIDLLKFSLLQRNLSRITAINLAGIRPYHDLSVKLGEGKDYLDREHELDLPLKDEGAYLVVTQGENLYASGLVLVSPLSLEVQEDQVSGRVRVTVKDEVADKYAANVHVKVIGSHNPQFVSGQTDLRGVFVADGILGTTTVIARVGQNRYAFHRGKVSLGSVAQPNAPADPAQKPAEGQRQIDVNGQLLEQIRQQNAGFNFDQRMNYRKLIDNSIQGVAPSEVNAPPVP